LTDEDSGTNWHHGNILFIIPSDFQGTQHVTTTGNSEVVLTVPV